MLERRMNLPQRRHLNAVVSENMTSREFTGADHLADIRLPFVCDLNSDIAGLRLEKLFKQTVESRRSIKLDFAATG